MYGGSKAGLAGWRLLHLVIHFIRLVCNENRSRCGTVTLVVREHCRLFICEYCCTGADHIKTIYYEEGEPSRTTTSLSANTITIRRYPYNRYSSVLSSSPQAPTGERLPRILTSIIILAPVPSYESISVYTVLYSEPYYAYTPCMAINIHFTHKQNTPREAPATQYYGCIAVNSIHLCI